MENHDDDTPTLIRLAGEVRDKALQNLGRADTTITTPENYDFFKLMDLHNEFTVAYDGDHYEGFTSRRTIGGTLKTYEAAQRALETARRDPNKKNPRVERRIVSEWVPC